jgi:hypothetical protein
MENNMGMDLLLVITELPDTSVNNETAYEKIAEAINNMSEKSRNDYRESVAYDADDDELIKTVQNYFTEYRNDSYLRNVQDWDTFDSDGNPRTVTIFGCESWGDVPEAFDAGSAFYWLPEKWWK